MRSGQPVAGSLMCVMLLSSTLFCHPLVEISSMLSLESTIASFISWKNSAE